MINRLRIGLIGILAAIALSGCVQYDLGIEFNDQTHGQITQEIQLSQQFIDLSQDEIQTWTGSIEQRVKDLGGKTEFLSPQNLQVSIPFYNGAELEQKFNQFYNSIALESSTFDQVSLAEIPQLSTQLNLAQQNLIFVLRNRLNLDIDLRSLALEVTDSQIIIDPEGLVDFDFNLTTPWGSHIIQSTSEEKGWHPLVVVAKQDGKQAIWQLEPGQINHIEAIFWVPSFVGIGTVVIVLFIFLGYFIRYQLFPPRKIVSHL
ncbi:MAG: DUF3153 domain-containing protein [Microcoleaceae cyanobacterium]